MTSSPPPAGERLAKVMARAGVCSRREAESWISTGRVAVNGETVKSPAFNVTENDKIAVDGKPIAMREPTQAWIYYKPAGLMVTEKDPEGRPTVFEEFEKLGLPRVLTVGRLDFNTEGLLILTNDGGVKRTLELPSTGWVRRYRVRAFGKVTQEQLDGLANGITVDGVDYGPIDAQLDSQTGSNVWMTLGLREGKNREVRNVLGALGLEVNRLIRISYGPFQLGELPEGAVERIKTRILKDQLGKRLAEQSGADFEGSEEMGNQPRRRTPEAPPRRAPERDRHTGIGRRPERAERARPTERPRTLHYDDGRPSESFTPDRRGGRDGDRPERGARGGDRPYGDRPPRGDKPAFAKGPRREGGDRPYGDRPPRGDKPAFAKGPRREGGDRPSRGDKPAFAKGPRREGGDRPLGDRPPRGDKPAFAKGPRREGGDRPFGDRPPRGGKPAFAKGPRREGGDRPYGDRPPRGDKPAFAKGPRREGGDRPYGDRPPRGDKPAFARGPRREGGDRPYGDRPPRGDKPAFAKGPRREGGDRPFGDRPPRGGKPAFAKGPRRDAPAGGRPPRAGDRPARPPRKPRPDSEE